jgi:hypothetical protein
MATDAANETIVRLDILIAFSRVDPEKLAKFALVRIEVNQAAGLRAVPPIPELKIWNPFRCQYSPTEAASVLLDVSAKIRQQQPAPPSGRRCKSPSRCTSGLVGRPQWLSPLGGESITELTVADNLPRPSWHFF